MQNILQILRAANITVTWYTESYPKLKPNNWNAGIFNIFEQNFYVKEY